MCGVQLLQIVSNKCCRDDDPCTGVLADIAGTNICDSPGNHCDANGDLTHLDLSQSNMHCSLLDVLEPLEPLAVANIQDFQLNDNDITGELDDPAVRTPPTCSSLALSMARRSLTSSIVQVLALLANWSGLQYLELGNLPQLEGMIPAACPPPFNLLIHLGLSDTGVGGSVPECLLQTIHQLEISRTRIGGTFPPIHSTNLRCASAASTHPTVGSVQTPACRRPDCSGARGAGTSWRIRTRGRTRFSVAPSRRRPTWSTCT